MRRGLSIVGLCLVLYTTLLALGSFAICEAGEVMDALGEWATQGHSAHVRIEPCTTTPQALCGIVASLRLRSPDILEVKGCLLFLCETQVWRRTESLCSQSR